LRTMKMSSIVTRWQPLVCILLALTSQPVVVYSDTTTPGQSQTGEYAPVAQGVTPESPEIAHKNRATTPVSSAEKKILIDEPRGELSTFLGIGIAINIIMAIVFTWWFTREWRKPRNMGGSKRVDQ
ncbi:MAG: hypothetical protein OQL16_03640, partial [Gammaproteobacteria bacterium]|nr:hypothetical protein [Gammaproteobacteria bacterium]